MIIIHNQLSMTWKHTTIDITLHIDFMKCILANLKKTMHVDVTFLVLVLHYENWSTVKDLQKCLRQLKQFTKTIKPKVDQVTSELHHLQPKTQLETR